MRTLLYCKWKRQLWRHDIRRKEQSGKRGKETKQSLDYKFNSSSICQQHLKRCSSAAVLPDTSLVVDEFHVIILPIQRVSRCWELALDNMATPAISGENVKSNTQRHSKGSKHTIQCSRNQSALSCEVCSGPSSEAARKTRREICYG